MQIISRDKGIFVEKAEGTKVYYHIFPEFEFHYNEVPVGTTQLLHHHEIIEEIVYIVSGQVEAHWQEEDKTFSQTVKSGDIIRVQNSPHTFMNTSNEQCIFVVFRFVPTGTDKRMILKNDKHLDKPVPLLQ